MELNFSVKQSKILVLADDVIITKTGIEYSFQNLSGEALFDEDRGLWQCINNSWKRILPRKGDIRPEISIKIPANTFIQKIRSGRFPTLMPGRYLYISSYFRESSIPVERFTEPECLRIEFNVDENTPDKLPKRPLPDGMVEELSQDGMMVTVRYY